MGIRDRSYPFDWLWNLDTGLESVIDIIENDFAKIQSVNAYSRSSHYRFPGKKMLVYSAYPSIIHLHSNPSENIEDHKTLLRRIQRFKLLLDDNQVFVNFIYYQVFDERLRKNDGVTVLSEFQRLRSEGNAFVQMMATRYPNKKFKLLLIYQTSPKYEGSAKRLVSQENDSLDLNSNPALVYGYSFMRNDKDEMQDGTRKKQLMSFINDNAYLESYGFWYKAKRILSSSISVFKR